MSFHFTLSAIAEHLALLQPYQHKTVLHYSIDSSDILSYTLFFAIKGQKFDGHTFLSDVAHKGAVAAIVDQDYHGPNFGLELFKVPNVTAALQHLASVMLLKRKQQTVAITGSLGKTTTKEFAAKMLQTKYRVAATIGNQNTQLTLPLTILNADPTADILVLEMGMTHSGQIAKLVHIAKPKVALITNVSYSHGENFTSLEQIAQAKAEIFSCPTTQGGIFLQESPHAELLQEKGICAKHTFSLQTHDADYSAHIESINPFEVLLFEEGQKIIRVTLPFTGKHNVQNFLAACALARKLDISWEKIAQVIPMLRLPQWRLETSTINGVLFINDAYNNSSPDAACSAIDSMPKPKEKGRKIVVLSEMRELGVWSEWAHKHVAEHALKQIDVMLCLGPDAAIMQSIWHKQVKPCYHFADRAQILAFLPNFLKENDVVLIKGSRFYQLYSLADELAKASLLPIH